MIKNIIHGVISNNNKEHFESRLQPLANALASLLAFLIVLVVLGFVGVFLWNNSIAGKGEGANGLFTTIKPANSIWQIICLYLLIVLLSPN
jgi:ABC-type Na+ efflux pump permease subunit